jgi:hypothetical protein
MLFPLCRRPTEKFEDIFDLGDEPEEEPTPPPKNPTPVAPRAAEDDEVQIEEEPVVVAARLCRNGSGLVSLRLLVCRPPPTFTE